MAQTHDRPAGNGAAAEQVGQTTSSVPPAGDMPRPVAGWCPPGGCTARRVAELERAVAFAFTAGRTYERAELAALELTTWRPLARKTHEEKVAERIAAMPGATPMAGLRFDDPDWPPVAVPGGGGLRLGSGQVVTARPDYLQHIGEPAPCPCRRLADGRHRVPDDALIGAAA